MITDLIVKEHLVKTAKKEGCLKKVKSVIDDFDGIGHAIEILEETHANRNAKKREHRQRIWADPILHVAELVKMRKRRAKWIQNPLVRSKLNKRLKGYLKNPDRKAAVYERNRVAIAEWREKIRDFHDDQSLVSGPCYGSINLHHVDPNSKLCNPTDTECKNNWFELEKCVPLTASEHSIYHKVLECLFGRGIYPPDFDYKSHFKNWVIQYRKEQGVDNKYQYGQFDFWECLK